jgi:hypothetical protein
VIKEQPKTDFELQMDKAERLTTDKIYDKAFGTYSQMYKQFKQ